jgi:hypothetical protein
MGASRITAGQIKKIHALANALAIDEDTYRAALESRFGASTSKALTLREAGKLIDEWEYEAIRQHVWRQSEAREKFMKRPYIPGMATPSQLRLIDTLWQEVSREVIQEKRDKNLRHYIQRIAKVADVRFLTSDAARKVITAIKKMQKFYQYDQEESMAAGD